VDEPSRASVVSIDEVLIGAGKKEKKNERKLNAHTHCPDKMTRWS
jgi:hypothetical protein